MHSWGGGASSISSGWLQNEKRGENCAYVLEGQASSPELSPTSHLKHSSPAQVCPTSGAHTHRDGPPGDPGGPGGGSGKAGPCSPLSVLGLHRGQPLTPGSESAPLQQTPTPSTAATTPGEPQLPVSIATVLCELQSPEGGRAAALCAACSEKHFCCGLGKPPSQPVPRGGVLIHVHLPPPRQRGTNGDHAEM